MRVCPQIRPPQPQQPHFIHFLPDMLVEAFHVRVHTMEVVRARHTRRRLHASS